MSERFRRPYDRNQRTAVHIILRGIDPATIEEIPLPENLGPFKYLSAPWKRFRYRASDEEVLKMLKNSLQFRKI